MKTTLLYERKDYNKDVNIFQRCKCYITRYASIYYKTYCFAFQKRLFCTVKA